MLPPSTIPIFTSVASYREWRRKVAEGKQSVGFVATMGALHEGHLSLGRRSLAANDLTVLSIFVNPAQFAPHEDLATYPRTLPHDLELLSSLSLSVEIKNGAGQLERVTRTPSAVFLPTVPEMYPAGISQDVSEQKGTFVDVKGYGHQMEGRTRPTFFRGVATVVTKLFNAVEPTRTYFGQKDIQQALLLRRMTRDLLLSHPTPENLFIVPTARDSSSKLALSSRNAYLTDNEREHAAPSLYAALQAGRQAWDAGESKESCVQRAYALISETAEKLNSVSGEKVDLKLDYIEMNAPESFDVLGATVTRQQWESEAVQGGNSGDGRAVIFSGAMWVGRTRLIDNIILGNPRNLGIME
ncbi:pantothenate synthetase [Wolfiporia cocos MD-104 SS10]|uniref:Pantoate--beta-alanine ligase n=1 Tax=Wolfiporia cocos (strain MD-104) TaxID=742152 RepID=A0A2H3J248_WOLCO|nr:pantothenate synthetase [Wolfiporia cocos MD-104 SS10]